MIYFVTARDIGRVKIGYSRNPQKRFGKIQTDSPVTLALERVCGGSQSDEAHLHARFSEYRIEREWFALCPEIEAHMSALPTPAKASRAVRAPTRVDPANGNPSALHSWLVRTGTTAVELARQCEYDPSNLSKLLRGKVRPSIKVAARIEQITDGAVPIAGWA